MQSRDLKNEASERDTIGRANLVRRLQATGRYPELADSVCEVPRDEYVDARYFRTEIEVLFRNYPQYVCLSAEIPNSGDYRTRVIGEVPILVIRGEDGIVRGFRNTCRHRGAPLKTDSGGCGSAKLICPYHGWTYDTFGKLIGVPIASAFPDLDRDKIRLQNIQVQEKYGLVFAVVGAEAPAFDIADHIGDIGTQFEDLGLHALEPAIRESITTPTNWKLAWETFGESYHVTKLHPRLASVIVGNGLVYDSFGPHGRITLPLDGIKDLLSQPEENWAKAESGVHILFHYLIFPNLVVTLMDGAMQIQTIMPGKHVGETVTSQTQAFSPSLPEEKKKNFANFFNLSLHDLTATEDYPMAIGIFNSLSAGSLDKTTLGRCEWPLHAFHRERHRLMGG